MAFTDCVTMPEGVRFSVKRGGCYLKSGVTVTPLGGAWIKHRAGGDHYPIHTDTPLAEVVRHVYFVGLSRFSLRHFHLFSHLPGVPIIFIITSLILSSVTLSLFHPRLQLICSTNTFPQQTLPHRTKFTDCVTFSAYFPQRF